VVGTARRVDRKRAPLHQKKSQKPSYRELIAARRMYKTSGVGLSRSDQTAKSEDSREGDHEKQTQCGAWRAFTA